MYVSILSASKSQWTIEFWILRISAPNQIWECSLKLKSYTHVCISIVYVSCKYHYYRVCMQYACRLEYETICKMYELHSNDEKEKLYSVGSKWMKEKKREIFKMK